MSDEPYHLWCCRGCGLHVVTERGAAPPDEGPYSHCWVLVREVFAPSLAEANAEMVRRANQEGVET